MLIAVALTLMVVLAIVRVFDVLGTNVTDSRAILELSGELRNAANLLQADLDRVTVRTIPPLSSDSGEGYLEIVEGIRSQQDIDAVPTSPIIFPAGMALGQLPVPLSFTKRVVAPLPRLYDPNVYDLQYLNSVKNLIGDVDDVLMMTIRSDGEPFRGRFNNTIVTSDFAEVIWWVERAFRRSPQGDPLPATGLVLHRRVLLIRPDLGFVPLSAPFEEMTQFLQNNDVSVRFGRDPVNPTQVRLEFNSLSDLEDRRNRYGHWWPEEYNSSPVPPPNLDPSFPHWLNPEFLNPEVLQPTAGPIASYDVAIADVIAFDIRVYDPKAPIRESVSSTGSTGYALLPSDPGFPSSTTVIGQGAFVDLGWVGWQNPTVLMGELSGLPNQKSRLVPIPIPTGIFSQVEFPPRVFCTWSDQYERDGLDQDGDNLPDEGTNGLDDPGQGIDGVVDDAEEHETSPPYSRPLRGVEILLRAQEYSTQQVRQVSVVGDFLPE